MQLLQFFKLLQDNSFGVVAMAIVFATLIQVAPIQINPWSSIVKFISSVFSGEICKKIEALESKIDNLEHRVDSLNTQVKKLKDSTDEDRAVTARARILRFADELFREQRHSKDSFDSTLTDIDYYEKYCIEHPNFKNNQTVMSVKHIKRVYEERLEKHDFLY